MDEQFKRPNKLTGKPFEPGFQDESGRVFLRYLKKQGNDGYFLEEWKKNIEEYQRKIKKLEANSD
jgi:hypothetical protein